MFRLIVALSVVCLVSGSQDASDVRVVNGKTASVSEFPYQVSIQQFGDHFCGGSILNEQWILTAGHCILDIIRSNQVNSLMVRAGTSNYNSGGVLKPVELAIAHEQYNPANMNYDVALMKLLGRLVFSSVIKPVRILKSAIPTGSPVVVSGWGRLGNSIAQLPTTLQRVTMSYLPLSECAKWHLNAVSDSMICAAGPGKDACMGDSGGPLCLDGTMTQVGVVSWGVRCAEAGLPGVYADLTNPRIISFLERYVGKLL